MAVDGWVARPPNAMVRFVGMAMAYWEEAVHMLGEEATREELEDAGGRKGPMLGRSPSRTWAGAAPEDMGAQTAPRTTADAEAATAGRHRSLSNVIGIFFIMDIGYHTGTGHWEMTVYPRKDGGAERKDALGLTVLTSVAGPLLTTHKGPMTVARRSLRKRECSTGRQLAHLIMDAEGGLVRIVADEHGNVVMGAASALTSRGPRRAPCA